MENVKYEVTAADDDLHPPTNDDLFWTETLWLAFAVPERRITGVLYPVFRANQAVCSLGISLWDDTDAPGKEPLYFQNYWHLPVPVDLRDFELPVGFAHRCLEPLRVYEVTFDDGAELSLSLRYAAIHPPVPRGLGGAVRAMMQPCHVTGSLRLNGEDLAVDCYELRGRGWGSRSDGRWPARPSSQADVMAFSDTYAMSPDISFLVATGGGLSATKVQSGFLFKDGELTAVVSGDRVVSRRSPLGQPEEVLLDLVDEAGRTVHAVGTCVNNQEIRSTPSIGFGAN